MLYNRETSRQHDIAKALRAVGSVLQVLGIVVIGLACLSALAYFGDNMPKHPYEVICGSQGGKLIQLNPPICLAKGSWVDIPE